MKKWRLSKILTIVACSTVLIGGAPWAYMSWWVSTHNSEPLSIQLALKRGEYTSPYFITDLVS